MAAEISLTTPVCAPIALAPDFDPIANRRLDSHSR